MKVEDGKKLLFTLANVLERLSIPFFLVQGTCLGAYRDLGFVPNEKDIDLGVLGLNLEAKALDLFAALADLNLDMEVHVRPLGFVHTFVVWGNGAKADIVGWHKHRQRDGREVRFAHCPVRPWINEPYAIVHDADILEVYQELQLFGRKFKVPGWTETYLEREYGADWRTPKEDSVSRTRVYNFLEKERWHQNG